MCRNNKPNRRIKRAACVSLALVLSGLTLWIALPDRLRGLLEPRAQAASLTVNSTGDGPDATPGDGICETAMGNGVCTLRAAIQEANALMGAETISFNIPAIDCKAMTNVCT